MKIAIIKYIRILVKKTKNEIHSNWSISQVLWLSYYTEFEKKIY